MYKKTIKKCDSYLKKCAERGQEGCALVIKDGPRKEVLVETENVISDHDVSDKVLKEHHLPSDGFMIHPKTYLKYSRQIKYIVHNHIRNTLEEAENDQPSQTDVIRQRATDVPWTIFVYLKDGTLVKHYTFGE